jgi:hypothetical protein
MTTVTVTMPKKPPQMTTTTVAVVVAALAVAEAVVELPPQGGRLAWLGWQRNMRFSE